MRWHVRNDGAFVAVDSDSDNEIQVQRWKRETGNLRVESIVSSLETHVRHFFGFSDLIADRMPIHRVNTVVRGNLILSSRMSVALCVSRAETKFNV